MRIQLSDGAVKDVPNEIAAQFIRAKKATIAPPAPPAASPAPARSGYDGSWESAVFPRATEGTPGSFAAKLGLDIASGPFRALATAPEAGASLWNSAREAIPYGDKLPKANEVESIGESMHRTGGRPDEPGWMQFLDDVLRSPVNAVLPGATRAGGALFKAAGKPAGALASAAIQSAPASLAIGASGQAKNVAEGKPVSLSQAAIDAAVAQALGTTVGGVLGYGARKLSDRTGQAREAAKQKIAEKMMPRDEALAMGIEPGQPGAVAISETAPELTIPQIKQSERGLPYAERAEADARDAFMGMMKFLPGKKNRAIWEAGFRLADDPKILEELLRDAKTIPDIVANQQAGKALRIAAREPITQAMDATGKKVPVADLVRAAEEAVLSMRKGSAAPTEANRAVAGMERVLYTPPPGQRAVYRDPGTGDFASSPTYSGDLPINAETELLPSVAQDLKSSLYSRARFETPDANVRDEATRATALAAKRALEEIDPTGKLKATNAAMADWIAASEGFLRAESRNANRDPRSKIMQTLFPKNSPEEIRRILMRAKLARSVGGAFESAETAIPRVVPAATDNARSSTR